jgi:uncharacterized protein
MKFLIGLIIVIATIIILMSLLQRLLIYTPNSIKPDISAINVIGMQEIIIHTSDGLSLISWYKAARKGRPTLLYLQGNSGNIEDRAQIIRPYLEKGYGILLLGYRGYGGNPGRPKEQGLYRDGNAAWQYLTRKNIPAACIIIYGESLGTGVAIELAVHHPAGALVLLAPYTSMDDVGAHLYPYLPVRLLLKDHFNSLAKIAMIKFPILMLAAKNDEVVPLYLTKQLYDASVSKKLVVYAHLSHNQLPGSVQQAVIEFIEKHAICK